MSEPAVKQTILTDDAQALTESWNSSRAAIQELTRAYQELALKNAKTATVVMQTLSSAKSPIEFMDLQQKLVRDGFESAIGDSRHIGQLTAAVFSAALEPMKKQIEALQKIQSA